MAHIHLAAAIAMCLLAGCAAQQPAAELPTSKICSFQSAGFIPAEEIPPTPNVITMDNDGGWCGHLSKTVWNSRVFGAPTRLVRPPAQGQVSITVLSDGTMILYKPNAGMSGTDSFSVRNDMVNTDMPYKVVVTR